ncbi:MAG: lectin, partial [Carnobacterium sp.]
MNLKKLVLSSLIAIIMPISAFSESRTALDEAPLGLQLDDIFTPTEMQNNSAKVYRNGNGTDVVIITDDGGQQGGLWSTEVMKLDLSQDFHASMKIYFDDVGSNSADGAAFVMHSDPKG